MVIWLTGLSGAGKSTVAMRLIERFKPHCPDLVHIDGDEVRALFGDSLGYKEADRYEQIRRIQRLTWMLDKQALTVVVAALYAHPDLLAWNRTHFSGYLEVYLDAPLEVVRARDPKRLYAKVDDGEMSDVVGIDVAWHAPETPDVRIDMAVRQEVDDVVSCIAARVDRLAAVDHGSR